MIEFGHLSHHGLQRRLNEDTYFADPQLGLWLVVDGMGGRQGGEVVSAVAREVIVRQVRQGASLEKAISLANEEVCKIREQNPRVGASVAALRIRQWHFEAAWVGDSRLYRCQDKRLKPLVPSNTVSTQLNAAAEGQHDAADTATSTKASPPRSSRTQALGITHSQRLAIATLRGEIKPHVQFLLCSDGLTEEMQLPQLQKILTLPHISAQECADTLVMSALNNGSSDNITALVVRID